MLMKPSGTAPLPLNLCPLTHVTFYTTACCKCNYNAVCSFWPFRAGLAAATSGVFPQDTAQVALNQTDYGRAVKWKAGQD